MSRYDRKLLELVAIESGTDTSYLRINLTISEKVELLWEIDNKTANFLKSVASFDESFKYRLSLTSMWDPARKQQMSYVTRTFRNESERIYFPCSTQYMDGIQAIKEMQHIDEVFDRPYFRLPELSIEEQDIKIEEVPILKTKVNVSWSWSRFAAVGVMFIVVFGFAISGYSSINEAEETGEMIAQQPKLDVIDEIDVVEQPRQDDIEDQDVGGKSEQDDVDEQDVDAQPKQDDFEEQDIVEESDQDSIDENDSDLESKNDEEILQPEFILPSVELNEAVTYSLSPGKVALTFDDGPSIYSKEIVDILMKYEAGGTFFYIGSNVKKYPDEARYVKANGYSIGSHTMNHPKMSQHTRDKQELELRLAKQAIEDVILEDVVLFRPPYGDKNETTLELLHNLDTKMVLWDRDPEDWKNHNPSKIFHYIANSNPSGSIILLHESQAVVDALPRIIEYLLGQGLEIVSLE